MPSIAVLPFANMSGDPEQAYFADGLVEDMITTLSKLSGLRVIARNSTFVYKGRAVDVREVGRELDNWRKMQFRNDVAQLEADVAALEAAGLPD